MTDHAAPARAIANWWTQQVLDPTFANGDPSSNGAFVTAGLSLLAAGSRPGADQAQAFADALAAAVQADLDRQASYEWQYVPQVTLGVDYGPDRMLSEAAKKAGVSTNRFPIKTRTYTYPDHVVVSLGYHGRDRRIWQAEDYVVPPCAAQQYVDGDPAGFEGKHVFAALPFRCGLDQYHDGEHDYSVPTPLCSTCNRPESYDHHDRERMIEGWGSDRLYHRFTAGAWTACTRCGTSAEDLRDPGRARCRRWVEPRTARVRVRDEGPVRIDPDAYGMVMWGPAQYKTKVVEHGHWVDAGEHTMAPVPGTGSTPGPDAPPQDAVPE